MEKTARVIFAVILAILFIFASVYDDHTNVRETANDERVVIAQGIIDQKIITPFACGEYGNDVCREYQWIVNGSAVVVSEDTYNKNEVGSHTTLTVRKDPDITSFAFLVGFFLTLCWAVIALAIFVIICRALFWLFFRSDSRNFLDYMLP